MFQSILFSFDEKFFCFCCFFSVFNYNVFWALMQTLVMNGLSQLLQLPLMLLLCILLFSHFSEWLFILHFNLFVFLLFFFLRKKKKRWLSLKCALNFRVYAHFFSLSLPTSSNKKGFFFFWNSQIEWNKYLLFTPKKSNIFSMNINRVEIMFNATKKIRSAMFMYIFFFHWIKNKKKSDKTCVDKNWFSVSFEIFESIILLQSIYIYFRQLYTHTPYVCKAYDEGWLVYVHYFKTISIFERHKFTTVALQ